MTQVWSVVICVVTLLLIERVVTIRATRSERGKGWIKSHRLAHPNTISVVRIPMGLLSVGVWLAGWQVTAIIWFSLWMISDLTDGTLARNCDLTTESGKWLDPLSDKCMYFPALIFFACLGVLPVAWTAAVVVIDAVGQLSRVFIRKKAANYFGKAKTALITILLSLTALEQIHHLWFMSEKLVYLLTISCAILAFMSLYCRAIPDEWYANTLTLANFLCGLAAIWNVSRDHTLRAFILVFVGQFFDLFDGRLARKYGSTRHGAVFDDIADGTSFGLAIGFLLLHELKTMPMCRLLALVYFLCVVFRLYRFLRASEDLPDGIFRGLPSPAGAMLAGSAVLLFGGLPLLATALVVLTSILMVSTIRYRHFGHRIWPTLPKGMKLLSFVLFLVFVNISIADKNYSGSFTLFCFTMASLYVIFGVERPPVEEKPPTQPEPPSPTPA